MTLFRKLFPQKERKKNRLYLLYQNIEIDSASRVTRLSSLIRVEKFDDSSLINRNLRAHSSFAHKVTDDLPNVHLVVVMNDANYDLSIGTNWTMDKFIFRHFHRHSIIERALHVLISKYSQTAYTSTKGFKILAIIFQLFSFLKTFKQHNGCHAQK
ncbi:CLUMA_CG006781, isoform A [Clunio marinus]|uniref:CLUMA_CG006781, isoform A n=1 Tax=Clunio marinus TaxID=568069 RepID=A0A1J1HYY3_9DIPT|nr:CLUMA_CG006781, isoform A [Clunio marinus]